MTMQNTYIDNPATTLVRALIAYWGVTTANGVAGGTTLVSGVLANYPSLAGRRVQILDGPAIYCERTVAIHPAGGNTITVTDPFTDNTGAVTQILAGTHFCVLGLTGGGVAPGPPPPSVGLWMLGVCDPAMVGSTVTLVMPNLAGMPDDIFNDDFYAEIIRNDNNVGLAPEHEIRLITNYVGATGTFTCDAFTANVEADDLVAIIHHSLIGPQLNLISTLVRAIFDIVNAGLVTTETGGTITTDGTEQNVYINNTPSGVFEPLTVQLDCTNMIAGDSLRIRVYYRIVTGGNLVKKDEYVLNGAQDPALKNIELEPNRFGTQVTMERLAGVDRAYDWSAFVRV